MSSVILDKKFSKGSQSFEVVVWYDCETNTVSEIKTIWLTTHGKKWPVSDLMMAFFEETINKLIDNTDWREVYRQMDYEYYEGIDISISSPKAQMCLAPNISH